MIKPEHTHNQEFATKEHELTEEDKSEIIAAIAIIENSAGLNDSQLKARCDAEQKIISYGNKVLPFLQQEFSRPFSPHRYFKFTLFADALSKEEDLDFLLREINKPNIIEASDGSSATGLSRAIIRILRNIRVTKTQDPRLVKVSQNLINLLKNPNIHSQSARHYISTALSVTGTPEAKKYIQTNVDKSSPDFPELLKYAKDSKILDQICVPPYKFDSWDEILRFREAYQESIQDTEPYIDNADLTYNASLFEKYDDTELEPAILSAIEGANNVSKKPEIEETAAPAVKLYMFNRLLSNPQFTQAEINKELIKINRLSELERESSEESNPLPTIGIEIETINENPVLRNKFGTILKKMGIPHYIEMTDELEVNTHFSYNAITQARIIQELAKMGVIRLEAYKNNQKQRVPDSDMLSLHINFGLPNEIKSVLGYNKDMLYKLNDVVTAAFCSPNRIWNRKTNTSINWDKEATESKKHKKNYPVAYADTNYTRLELRATEFKDYPSFRMLVETQRLAAMLIANLKTFTNLRNINTVENALSDLWQEFYMEADEYFEKIGYNQANMVDEDPEKMIDIMRNTNIKKYCRSLISKYSRAADQIILKNWA